MVGLHHTGHQHQLHNDPVFKQSPINQSICFSTRFIQSNRTTSSRTPLARILIGPDISHQGPQLRFLSIIKSNLWRALMLNWKFLPCRLARKTRLIAVHWNFKAITIISKTFFSWRRGRELGTWQFAGNWGQLLKLKVGFWSEEDFWWSDYGCDLRRTIIKNLRSNNWIMICAIWGRFKSLRLIVVHEEDFWWSDDGRWLWWYRNRNTQLGAASKAQGLLYNVHQKEEGDDIGIAFATRN